MMTTDHDIQGNLHAIKKNKKQTNKTVTFQK